MRQLLKTGYSLNEVVQCHWQRASTVEFKPSIIITVEVDFCAILFCFFSLSAQGHLLKEAIFIAQKKSLPSIQWHENNLLPMISSCKLLLIYPCLWCGIDSQLYTSSHDSVTSSDMQTQTPDHLPRKPCFQYQLSHSKINVTSSSAVTELFRVQKQDNHEEFSLKKGRHTSCTWCLVQKGGFPSLGHISI